MFIVACVSGSMHPFCMPAEPTVLHAPFLLSYTQTACSPTPGARYVTNSNGLGASPT